MAAMRPVILHATAHADRAELTWEPKGPRPDYYQVRRDGQAIGPNLSWRTLAYTDSAVTPGQVYTYKIRSAGPNGSAYSNPETVTIPAPPVPVTAPVLQGTAGNAQVSLSWTAVANATSYTLQRKTTGAYADINAANVLSYLDTGRTNGTAYTYRVRGTAGAANGPWSNEVARTPVNTVPIAPTLTGVAGDSENSLDWNTVANAATYRLRRSANGGPLYVFPDTAATDYIDDTVINDTSYEYTVRGINSDGVLGSLSNPVTLVPEAVAPPAPAAIVGYAAVAGVTGGTGGTTHNCTTWAQFKTACEANGTRIVALHGSAVLDGNGAGINITNPNITIDGSDWTGSTKDHDTIMVRTSNVIIKQMRIRPGERTGGSDDVRAVTLNNSGARISRIVLDHCSLAWGPDVVFSILNGVEDVTLQYCILGPCLYESNTNTSPNGYGPNITVPGGGDPNVYPARVTYYRNLIVMNDKRNFRGHGVDGWDVVNNALYDWGSKSGHGNPRGANIMNNVFKQGPESTNAEGWDSEVFGAYNTYFTNGGMGSVYFNGNIGLNEAGNSINLTKSFAPSVERQNVYAGGPTAPSHGALTVSPATSALFTSIVNGAGPTVVDAIDELVKDHALAGTSDGFYNGAGFDPPHPSW